MRGKQERRVLEEEEKRQRRVEKTIRLCDGEVADSTSNTLTKGSFRVRSTNGLRVTPPISMKFGTLADNA